MRIGILGGTFDPPHRAHLELARHAMAAAGLDRVLLLPAGDPPHKQRSDLTAARHRLAMTRHLVEGESDLRADGREVERDGPSYTVRTLEALRAEHPDDTLRLIIGADMALEFGAWREAGRVATIAPPLVAERPGSPLPSDLRTVELGGLDPKTKALLQAGRFAMPPCDLSSSAIRARVAAVYEAEAEAEWTTGRAGGPGPAMADGARERLVAAGLTPAVAKYVLRHRLYDPAETPRGRRPGRR